MSTSRDIGFCHNRLLWRSCKRFCERQTCKYIGTNFGELLKMSTHFSANQYEQAFAAQRLQNWEIPQGFKERPSQLEGFTQPISNDRGHILPGIPRSSKSPWGEFIGTWDMTKPPLRTKTLKTVASKGKQNEEPAPEKVRSPSPGQGGAPEKARTPSPQQDAVRTPSPRPLSQENCRKTPSPARLKTPDAPLSPRENNAPEKKQVTLIG